MRQRPTLLGEAYLRARAVALFSASASEAAMAAQQPSSRKRTVCTDCLRILRHRRKHKHNHLLNFAPRQLHDILGGARPNAAATNIQGAVRIAQSAQRRHLATVTDAVQRGPLEEYDERVHTRRLRDDEHQRSESLSRVDSGRFGRRTGG
jgi:hypothetical protein